MALVSIVTFRTTPELKVRINGLAKRTRRSAGFYYNVLLEDHIDEFMDIFDAIQITENIKAGKEKAYSLESVAKELSYVD